MNIYVFKTSIHPQDTRHINSILRSIIPECFWAYDLNDCDKILRTESEKNIVKSVCFHLRMDGFACEELE